MVAIDVIVEDDWSGSFPVDEERLKAFALGVFERAGIDKGECNIVFICDPFMTELNETYKGRDGSTDVLSFDLTDDTAGGFTGEVYVSLDRAYTQAEERGIPLAEEIVRLVAHGLLHLSGRVHDTEAGLSSMTGDTEELVRTFFSGRNGL
jgi:probable rRNA maturation factor